MVNEGETFGCEVCKLEFTSQSIVDAHMAGAKHQRKLKAQELLWKLQETESCFTHDEASGKLTCLVCDVELTSPQLLESHLAGTKHKNKCGKRGLEGGNGTEPSKKGKSVPGEYHCKECQINCNSSQQMEQHVTSKKHLNKVAASQKEETVNINAL
ncbi:unnamed protein product [Meganyctiphanes norvegica]|uniref:C2H2-type domain-containing protein n=1 Tax=Meganyctiphanes norvegica TaxID=48144 RepID=A0AAV2SIG9_MEGNR